jgi:sodium transport system permease protein
MKSRSLWVILKKELIDGLRDRRSLLSALSFSLLGPVVVALMLQSLAAQKKEHLSLSVVGAENAPSLISYLEQNKVRLLPPPKDAEAAVRAREQDVVLVIPEEFREAFLRSEPAPLKLITDSARPSSQETASRTQRILSGYSHRISLQRLMIRGVSADLLTPIAVQSIELSTERSRASSVLSMLALFLMVAAFVAGMNTAIDTTAGERERGSLESLLLRPASKLDVTLGKWLATTIFSLAGLVLAVVFSIVVLRSLKLDGLGIFLSFGMKELLLLLAVLAPLTLLASGLQMWVSTFARSFKEGQTYLSLLLFVPMLPGLMVEMYQLHTAPWMAVVPIMGQQELVSQALAGNVPPTLSMLGLALGTLGCSVVLVYLTSRLLGSEEIVLGR